MPVQLGNVIRIRPRNISGWLEFLRCLYLADMHEEGLEYALLAHEQTDQKPVFLFFQTLFLLALGKSKDALLMLETAMQKSPKHFKEILDINPSLLQHQQVVEILARYKKKKSR